MLYTAITEKRPSAESRGRPARTPIVQFMLLELADLAATQTTCCRGNEANMGAWRERIG